MGLKLLGVNACHVSPRTAILIISLTGPEKDKQTPTDAQISKTDLEIVGNKCCIFPAPPPTNEAKKSESLKDLTQKTEPQGRNRSLSSMKKKSNNVQLDSSQKSQEPTKSLSQTKLSKSRHRAEQNMKEGSSSQVKECFSKNLQSRPQIKENSDSQDLHTTGSSSRLSPSHNKARSHGETSIKVEEKRSKTSPSRKSLHKLEPPATESGNGKSGSSVITNQVKNGSSHSVKLDQVAKSSKRGSTCSLRATSASEKQDVNSRQTNTSNASLAAEKQSCSPQSLPRGSSNSQLNRKSCKGVSSSERLLLSTSIQQKKASNKTHKANVPSSSARRVGSSSETTDNHNQVGPSPKTSRSFVFIKNSKQSLSETKSPTRAASANKKSDLRPKHSIRGCDGSRDSALHRCETMGSNTSTKVSSAQCTVGGDNCTKKDSMRQRTNKDKTGGGRPSSKAESKNRTRKSKQLSSGRSSRAQSGSSGNIIIARTTERTSSVPSLHAQSGSRGRVSLAKLDDRSSSACSSRAQSGSSRNITIAKPTERTLSVPSLHAQSGRKGKASSGKKDDRSSSARSSRAQSGSSGNITIAKPTERTSSVPSLHAQSGSRGRVSSAKLDDRSSSACSSRAQSGSSRNITIAKPTERTSTVPILHAESHSRGRIHSAKKDDRSSSARSSRAQSRSSRNTSIGKPTERTTSVPSLHAEFGSSGRVSSAKEGDQSSIARSSRAQSGKHDHEQQRVCSPFEIRRKSSSPKSPSRINVEDYKLT